MKLIKKLSVLILPVVVYFMIFWAFEPYNYFGIKSTADTGSVIYRVRSFDKSPQNAIILGDSRMAHFDSQLVNEISGKSFSNLAFGGAALRESIDMFYYAYGKNPNIDTVYMGVSFYTLRSDYDVDRIKSIETLVKNPIAYMLNFDYNVEMLNSIVPTLNGSFTGTESETATYTKDDYTDENGSPLPYRRQLIDYAQNSLLKALPKDYKLNEEQLDRLVKLSRFCDEKGIALTFVFPPMDKSVSDLVVAPLNIEPSLQYAISTLKATNARVLDYELELDSGLSESQFFDGFHIDTVYGLPQFTKLLFAQ